jgi:hypothetical protein
LLPRADCEGTGATPATGPEVAEPVGDGAKRAKDSDQHSAAGDSKAASKKSAVKKTTKWNRDKHLNDASHAVDTMVQTALAPAMAKAEEIRGSLQKLQTLSNYQQQLLAGDKAILEVKLKGLDMVLTDPQVNPGVQHEFQQYLDTFSSASPTKQTADGETSSAKHIFGRAAPCDDYEKLKVLRVFWKSAEQTVLDCDSHEEVAVVKEELQQNLDAIKKLLSVAKLSKSDFDRHFASVPTVCARPPSRHPASTARCAASSSSPCGMGRKS